MSLDTLFTSEDAENLDSLARQAFECLAEMSPEATEERPGSPWDLIASVVYGGNTFGRVDIHCDFAFAYLFTERFMQVPPPGGFDENVADALGELANTVGGNYKGLLSPDTSLSIPRVAYWQGGTQAKEGERELGRVTYHFGCGMCEVIVFGSKQAGCGAGLGT